jgi:hypothetical protein
MVKNMYEIFEEIQKCKTADEKVAVLKKNDRMTLRQVLSAGFDPAVKFSIKKIPDYVRNTSPVGMSESNIDMEMKKFYIFLEGNMNHYPPSKKELRLREILETLEAREAEVVSNIILKNLKIYGLNKRIVKKAFPGLINEPEEAIEE